MQGAAESLKRKREATSDLTETKSLIPTPGSAFSMALPAAAEAAGPRNEANKENSVGGSVGAGASGLTQLRCLLQTGLCYDVRMRYHSRLNTTLDAYTDPHPEDPRRTFRIYKMLADSGLINDPSLSGSDNLGAYMRKLPVTEAKPEQLLLVHSQEHLDFIASTSNMETADLVQCSETGDSIYVNNDSHMAAKLSCGGAIAACRAVVEDRVKNALALIRPPGHHAEPDAPGGFCLFSNVSVAAKVMLKEYPDLVKRVVVVDWDVHHGNGTQKAFYDDPRVLYISLHRYERGTFYPGTRYGGMDMVGSGKGIGFNVNIPWDRAGAGDVEYMTAFSRIVMPICTEFEPSLVIISAGFDAAHGDPIGGCHVSGSGYGYMTHALMSLAGGHLVVCLEGGYNLDAISVSATAVAKVLLGEPPVPISYQQPQHWAMDDIENVVAIQSAYWKCFGHQIPQLDVSNPDTAGAASQAPEESAQADSGDGTVRSLYHAIRSAEVRQLIENHKFIRLPLCADEKLFNVHPDFVAVSEKVYEAEKLFLIIHDGPRVWGTTDLALGVLDPSEAVVANPLHRYINWGIANGYGIVDVSMPTEKSKTARAYGYIEVHELATYLWDSALEHYGAKEIILLGIGDAYVGALHLYGHRDLKTRCKAFITFLETTPLKPLVSTQDDSLISMFYRTSLIFTSMKHKCWDTASNPKKPRKKFGHVIKAHSHYMHELINERFDESIKFICDA